MSLKSRTDKRNYCVPTIVLSQCFVEESIANSSASIVIGNQDESYNPMIEDWGAGSQDNYYKELDL
mgnify:CR=1 FL=1